MIERDVLENSMLTANLEIFYIMDLNLILLVLVVLRSGVP